MKTSEFESITIKHCLDLINGKKDEIDKKTLLEKASKHQKLTFNRMEKAAKETSQYFKDKDSTTQNEYLNFMFYCLNNFYSFKRQNLENIYFNFIRKE